MNKLRKVWRKQVSADMGQAVEDARGAAPSHSYNYRRVAFLSSNTASSATQNTVRNRGAILKD